MPTDHAAPYPILLNIPIYIQTPPADGGSRNRHILLSIRLLHVDTDSIRIETSWNLLDCSSADTDTAPGITIPRRQGVQAFVPRDPFTMPLYVMITRRNRFGTSYHVAVSVRLREWTPGALDVEIEYMRIRRRNVMHSSSMRIVRSNGAFPADPPEVESRDADVNEPADNAELTE